MKHILSTLACTCLAASLAWAQTYSEIGHPLLKASELSIKSDAEMVITKTAMANATADDIPWSMDLIAAPQGGAYLNYEIIGHEETYHSSANVSGVVAQVCFGQNDTVFFKNIISGLSGLGYWVYGILKNDTVTIPSFQRIYAYANGSRTLDLFACAAVLDNAADSTYSLAPDFKLSMDADSVFRYIDHDGLFMAVSQDQEIYYYNSNNTLKPFTATLVEVPSGLESKKFAYKYTKNTSGNCAVVINALFDNDDVYLQGLCRDTPEAWVKGNIVGDSLIIPTHQYVGITRSNFYTDFVACKVGSSASGSDMVFNMVDYLALSLSTNHDTLIANSDDAILEMVGTYSAIGFMFNLTFSPFEERPATPARPYIYNASGGFLDVILAIEDVDGNFINPDSLGYRLYFDDELYTFETSLYTRMPESVDAIAYNYSDAFDIISAGTERLIYIYENLYETIGLEMIYTIHGETHVSERYTYVALESSVEEMVDDNHAQAVKITYTDLCGRQISQPTQGCFIKTIHYADGSRKSTKMMKH